ncbi:MAG TPA: class I SAM-dependent methyltransferase [Thiotrichaceae bacterium]|nr:class I SAM-dependent methyltransferase [Thiotrichaceae bacterium]
MPKHKTTKDSDLENLRQDIQFTQTMSGHDFRFKSTWGIFSPKQIDAGTLLLMKYIKIQPNADCFDLGCGYGPIGIALAKMAPQGETLMVDKDFMAVEYANKNAILNHVSNATAMLSNGFDHIDKAKRFDVIVSNVPAKVGKEMLSLIFHDAEQHLKPGGKIYLVTINGLRQYIKRNLKLTFGNYKKIKQGANYTISYAQKER